MSIVDIKVWNVNMRSRNMNFLRDPIILDHLGQCHSV